jgi:ABC-type multidrug transport system permease subunit
MYNVVPYSMSYFLAEIPYILFNTLLFVTIFYLMANFERDAAKFFWFWFFFMLNTTVMVSHNIKHDSNDLNRNAQMYVVYSSPVLLCSINCTN